MKDTKTVNIILTDGKEVQRIRFLVLRPVVWFQVDALLVC